MNSQYAKTIEDAVGLAQAGRDGYHLAQSSNGLEYFNNILSLTSTFAGNGPWAVGLNQAAMVSGSIQVYLKFEKGELKASDVTAVLASSLSLAVAASVAAGSVAVTAPLVAAAAAITLALGDETVNSKLDELAGLLADAAFEWRYQYPTVDVLTMPFDVNQAAASGSNSAKAVIRQYGVGSEEVVTVEFLDRHSQSTGELGKVTGSALAYVAAENGRYVYRYDSASEVATESWFEPNRYHTINEYVVPISDSGYLSGSGFMQSVRGNIGSGIDRFDGNSPELIREALNYAGMRDISMASFFDPSSMTAQFVEVKEWLSHGELWYNVQDFIDADELGREKFWELYQLEKEVGESKDHEQLERRAEIGISSPIAVDLAGDGLHTISLDTSAVIFDITGDGNAEHTGWLGSADAFLALDGNGNGAVDDVNEMFGGSKAGEGYLKLTRLDSSKDGLLSELDQKFAQLLLWQDQDSDGITDGGELKTLKSVGFTSLSLSYDSKAKLDNGNLIGENSIALLGSESRLMADIYFRFQDASSSSLPAVV